MGNANVHLVHYAPGRARLKIETLRGDATLADRVQDTLQAVTGIRSVGASSTTGSVLVAFDDRELRTPAAITALKQALTRLLPESDLRALTQLLLRTFR